MQSQRISTRASSPTNWYLWLVFICCLNIEKITAVETVEVYEGLPPGSAILDLKRKPGIVYSLYQDSSTADGLSLFYIDSSGVLTTKVTLDYEDERGNVFELLVISRQISKTEGGFGRIVRVKILDRNDNPPKFPKDLYASTILENSPIGSYVQGLESVFATDLDSEENSVRMYSIVAGNEAGKFEVDFHELAGFKFLRLKTKALIDREETPFFVLTVQVSDRGKPSLSSTTQVRVDILDENDCKPKFELALYSISVNENADIGTSVLQVKATDGDTGTNAEIYYYFKPEHDYFTIDPHTGTVRTASELNFKKGNSFDLTVFAVDRGINRREAKAIVRIRLVDIAGFPPPSLGAVSVVLAPPVFHKHSYFIRIREDFPVGGAIVTVNAHQGTKHRTHERTWRYIILDEPTKTRTVFRINPLSGVISLLEPLDFENKTSFSLTITAQEKESKEIHESHTRVMIDILDVNENHFAPVFSHSTLLARVAESARENTVISTVSASDADEGSNGEVRFSLTGGTGLGKFRIDRRTGKIRSIARFSSEMDSYLNLHVRARDRSKQPLHSNLFMIVRLENSDLKRPFFYSPRQVLEIRENNARGTFVALVRAVVRTRRGIAIDKSLEYFISGGNGGGKFSLNSSSGIISTAGSLDREKEDLYILDVHARVKGNQPSTSSLSQIVVKVTDENDNSPSFEQQQYKVIVTENLDHIPNLLCLVAHDPDAGQHGNISYSILSSSGPFSIDPVLGTLSADKSLDFEVQSSHKIVIQAADNGQPSRNTTTMVQITVQDANDAPVFSQDHYQVTVPESRDVGEKVALLHTTDQDRDKNGKFTCSMEDMDLETMDTFTVRTTPTGCALVLSGYLDWSYANTYSFKIRATDHAEPAERKSAVASVTIHVQDTNNHVPEFVQSSYWVALASDASAGSTVLAVQARDLDELNNNNVRYKLSSDVFAIDAVKGTITLKQGLGSVSNKKYDFSVRATDQGTPNRQSAVSVSVSVHSLPYIPPRFLQSVYTKVVAENFRSGVELLRVRAQRSVGLGSAIEYLIVGGDPSNTFSVGTHSGVVALRKRLDYEKVTQHVLVVRAVQKGLSRDKLSLPTEATVIVNVTDVNDNRPRFALPVDPFVTSVDELQLPDTIVTIVKAYDKDSINSRSIKYGLVDPYFYINSRTGVIYTTSELKHSDSASRSFVVTANDSTPPNFVAKANIVVMINRASPRPTFGAEEVAKFVPENVRLGFSPLRLTPQETPRVTLKYAISSGNEARRWCIDTTGKLRVNQPMDYEESPSYHLKVTVEQSSRSYLGPSVIFTIEDINDNAPTFKSNTFKFFVSENLPEYHRIGTLIAQDPDQGSNSKLRYSIAGVEDTRSQGLFEITSTDGVLRTTRALDREHMEQHVLTIRADDEGKPSLSGVTRVTVIVTDQNDNDPVFATDVIRAWVPVDAKPGSRIIGLVASDADWGENGLLRYFIIEGNLQHFISVNPSDGSVVLDRPLTSLKPIKFKVMAFDLGRPPRNATADVTIIIHAVEGPPQFLLESYEAIVTENKEAGTEVVKVEAASRDPVVKYSLTSGNEKGAFHLDSKSGLITTTRPLDHETLARYELVVMVVDTSNRLNHVKVVINVENVNDNQPYFIDTQGGVAEGQVLAEAIAGSHVMWLKARDRDTDDVITYSIMDDKAQSYFNIDINGTLMTIKAVSSLQSPFVFKVEASDNRTPRKRAVISVRIVFLKYHSQQRELRSSVREDLARGSLITRVKDAARIRNARFSIISPFKTPFIMNSETGDVSVERTLDYETTQNYSLIIQVQNDKDSSDRTNIDLFIDLQDVNDNAPYFNRGLYFAKVNRNPNQGTVVYTVTASDRDSRSHLRYSVVSEDDDAVFEVGAESGDVRTRDRHVLMSDAYNVTVRVSDSDTPPMYAEVLLRVEVGEYPPTFSQDEYVFTIEENTRKGYTIGHIIAWSYSGALLSYSIVHGNNQKKFSLDSNTGRLALPNPLDYERDSNVFYVRIKAMEVGITSRQSSEVNVRVLLKDLNDNAPEFIQQRYLYTLPESAPVGTTVLSVAAEDRDSGINGQFRYYMNDAHFNVNPYTGEISTAAPLDYDKPHSRAHAFVVVAQDSGNPSLNGTTRVVVTLNNVNDNPPQFSQTVYNVFVAEDADPGKFVATVQASDKDLDPVSYSILAGDNSSNFVIDSRTGVVRLVTKRQPKLVGPYYILNISASDGRHVSEAVLLVAVQDINNHRPVFVDCHKYRPVIAENLPAGSPVIKVSAEDADIGDNGRISYHIERPESAMPFFKIDNKTGLVTTAMTFDRETKRAYQIRITGKDGGPDRQEAERLMGFCQVEIVIADENDNRPVFDNDEGYRTNVPEDFEVGHSVLHVSATDKDAGSNALITYLLENPNAYFKVSNTTGIITTKRSLTLPNYKFSVTARDNGHPPQSTKVLVIITVFKVGNDPPKFTQNEFNARLREEALMQIVTRVQATSRDPDKHIFYSIVNYPTPFNIDPTDGVIRNLRRLDYEVKPNYTLIIRAQNDDDPPLESFARVRIFLEDVNDSPPEFPVSKYEGQVAENSKIGSSVIEVKANDPDEGENGRVSYKFLREKSYDWFDLDKITGLISTKKTFDREETGRYTLIVEARDHGDPSKESRAIVDVIIGDQNDNSPTFTPSAYNASVFEDVSIGTPIIRVTAFDKDIGNNAIINFYITAGNKGAVFNIDKDLGQISIASSLDRETQAYYELHISAVDGKNSGKAVVYIHVIDVNDNNPAFSNNTYVAWVDENAPGGSYVTTLSATDRDLGQGGLFSFSISGQGLNAFRIDQKTGVLRTIRSLDREAKAKYDFLAFATDNPEAETGSRRTGSCDIIIRVRDVNDNSPQFPDERYEGSVRENQLPGARVMVISAVDEDDPNENGNAIMTYKLIDDSNGLFKIDSDSGLITTRAKLDREQKDRYTLVVKATDRGHPQLSGRVKVKVKVSDANDQRPRFIEKTFSARVSENAAIGSTITVLNATDDDIGINAKLRFSIVEGGTEGEGEGRRMFRVVEDTGVLQVARSLDYESKKEYQLTVKVSDSGIPSYSDTAEVTISIMDYNDNPPVFHPVSYDSKIKEDVIPEVFLLQVTASDADTGSNKKFEFSIFEGDPLGRFRIDSELGNLYVHRRLDRETQEVHLLTIRATNIASDPLYGDASVKITLIDVNDNGPTFRPSVFHFSVRENSSPHQSLGTIDVYDKDLDPPNGAPFSFEIMSGNEDNFFYLDKSTGKVYTRATFDREKIATYMLGIRAWDNGQQKSDTFLHVHITDDNDNQHSSGHLELELNSFKGKFPGGRVGKVYVKDEDTDDERYFDVISNSSEYFTIERFSGMIVSRPNPPKGVYWLSTRVSDVNSSFDSVVCTVSIVVKEISAEAVQNSMAIRLEDISRERFITKFMPQFKESVAELLGTHEDNVDLFSVQNAPKDPSAIDVRFAAHGSPYYPAERMTAILKNARPLLVETAQKFDVVVSVIGVDECLYEPCESGGCTNVLIANGDVEVISVKDTSFASIVAILTAECDDCESEVKERSSCWSKPCLNGGTCLDTPTGHVCRCPLDFDGPNCEFTTRSFEPGEWIWLSPPQQCSVGSLSLEFATRDTNGLLLYGGPTSPVGQGDVHDFVSVELAGGKVLVSLSLGDRNDVVRVGVTSGMALNDGEWHHIEVQRNGTLVLVTVDKCKGAPLMEGVGQGSIEDRSHCSSSARMKGDKNRFLNLNGPLQIGGVSTVNLPYPRLAVTDFKGCIRNVVSNGKLYDLKNPSNRNGTKEGCPMVDQHCVQHQCHAHAVCVPSWTGYSCSCPFGLTGLMCGQTTRPLSYGEGSFTRYVFQLRKFKYDPRETKIQMQIRTRDSDGGVLMFNLGSEDGLFSSLEVEPFDSDGDGDSELIVTYTIGFKGRSHQVTRLTGVHVGDGRWHNISVVRERTQLVLAVDSDGDGYSVTEILGSEYMLFVLDPTRTFIGGLHPSTSALTRRRRDVTKDFVGCINDVRFNGHLLHYNGTTEIGDAVSRGVSEGCSSGPVCKPNSCPASQWCYDVWRKFVCLPLLCLSHPCLNGGTCFEGVDSNGNSRFSCECPVGFEGSLCELGGAVVVAHNPEGGFGDGLIIGLVVLVVTLIISVCILTVYLRRSRPKKLEVVVDEEQFNRDNVVDYRIVGGGEEDLDEGDDLDDILKSFETSDYSPCQSPGGRFRLSGDKSDVKGTYVALTTFKGPDGKPALKPVEKLVKPDKQETKCSYDGSEEEPPDSSSSPSAKSTPERRVRVSSTGGVGERHSPEGGEGGGEGSPRRKLTQVFGLNREEQEGRRSPPEGFSSPDKFESPVKRQRGNGASLQRPAKNCDEGCSEKETGDVKDGFPFPQAESFAMENPLSQARPSSDVPDGSKEGDLPSKQRLSLPPKKPPRRPPSGVPPPPVAFLPDDAMHKFFYEGSGSPTISLSTLGDSDRESDEGDNYEYVNDLGNKFKKLARIYGLTPSVTFNPHDEVIRE